MSNNLTIAADLTTVLSGITTIDTVVDAIRAVDVPAITGSITGLNDLSLAEIVTASFLPSEDLIFSSDDMEQTSITLYKMRKEIKVSLNGWYRIKFDLYHEVGNQTSYGKIYKDGVAYGIEQSKYGTSHETKTQDLYFEMGELLQIYLKSSSAGQNARVNNLRIYGNAGIYFQNIK